MTKYRCNICGYVYEPGAPWSELPTDWVCPVCGVPKDQFSPVEEPKPEVTAKTADAAPVTRTYSNGEISVLWVPVKCNHNGNCWRRLPAVFNPKARPWVDIKAADSATIATVVEECPTGALSVTWEKKQA